MKKIGPIESAWKSFAESIFAGMTPGTVQYNEMRKAFYGGAAAVFLDTTGRVAEMDEDDGCRALSEYKDEIGEWIEACELCIQ